LSQLDVTALLNLELFVRFALISLIAFGGGQAALPLVERMAVHDTGWLSASTFGTAVAFGYLTPGPVLITATFVGQQVAGLSGAISATVGAFLAPWALSVLAAREVSRFARSHWLRGFGAGATPAVVGILGVTVLDIARESLVSWPYVAICAVALGLAVWTRLHPVALLALGGAVGWFI
jgi:chromate transporter